MKTRSSAPRRSLDEIVLFSFDDFAIPSATRRRTSAQ